LKYYVYVRMLPTDRSIKSSGAIPAASTFIVSATWHGFYSGYQLFFGTAAFFNYIDTTAGKFISPRVTAFGVPMSVQYVFCKIFLELNCAYFVVSFYLMGYE